MEIDVKLRQWANTDRQKEIFDLLVKHGSYGKVAKKLNISRGTVEKTYKRIRNNASNHAYIPEHGCDVPLPDSLYLKKFTFHADGNNNIKNKWISGEPSKEKRMQRVMTALEEFASQYEGYSKASLSKPKGKLNDKLLTTYNIGDAHIGMHSWHEATGADWDLKIAEQVHVEAVRKLVDRSPNSKTAIVAAMGDFFHTDTNQNRTLASGHILDVDTRWEKIIEVGCDTIVACIELALEKHEKVIVVCLKGNHDEHSSFMLAKFLAAWFRKNKRVEVKTPHNFYHYIQHGKCLLGFSHGHTVKPQELPSIMADDMPEAWGQTKWRHWYTGHVHHLNMKGYRGCKVETLEILAPEDYWAHKSGYRSDRRMNCDIWHELGGRIGQFSVGADEILEELNLTL